MSLYDLNRDCMAMPPDCGCVAVNEGCFSRTDYDNCKGIMRCAEEFPVNAIERVREAVHGNHEYCRGRF